MYILVQIIEFKNNRAKDTGCTGCMKLEKKMFLFLRISAACISLLCYSTMSKLILSIGRDTGNNLLSGTLATTCCQGHWQQPVSLVGF